MIVDGIIEMRRAFFENRGKLVNPQNGLRRLERIALIHDLLQIRVAVFLFIKGDGKGGKRFAVMIAAQRRGDQAAVNAAAEQAAVFAAVSRPNFNGIHDQRAQFFRKFILGFDAILLQTFQPPVIMLNGLPLAQADDMPRADAEDLLEHRQRRRDGVGR